MPRKRQPQPDGDDSPDERPSAVSLAWLEPTRAAVLQLVCGEGPRLKASAETVGRMLAMLEVDREPTSIYIGRDRRSLRVRWANGERSIVAVITSGRPDYATHYLGEIPGKVVLLRPQPLDVLRTLVLELGR